MTPEQIAQILDDLTTRLGPPTGALWQNAQLRVAASITVMTTWVWILTGLFIISLTTLVFGIKEEESAIAGIGFFGVGMFFLIGAMIVTDLTIKQGAPDWAAIELLLNAAK